MERCVKLPAVDFDHRRIGFSEKARLLPQDEDTVYDRISIARASDDAVLAARSPIAGHKGFELQAGAAVRAVQALDEFRKPHSG
jgi:hypothetical protein